MCPQMYFNSTLTDSSKLLKPLLVFSFIICAIICGLTRIIQYKNHAIDVYLGFLLGGAIAVYLVGASPVSSLFSNGVTFSKGLFGGGFVLLSLRAAVLHDESHWDSFVGVPNFKLIHQVIAEIF